MQESAVKKALLDAFHRSTYEEEELIRDIADDLDIRLFPREVQLVGEIYATLDYDGVRLETVSLYDQMNEQFGDIWGGTKVEITIKEIM